MRRRRGRRRRRKRRRRGGAGCRGEGLRATPVANDCVFFP